MKKRHIILLVIALFTIMACQQSGKSTDATNADTMAVEEEKDFYLSSQELNKHCPLAIDSLTTLDSTQYTAANNTFSYFYTLSGDADNTSNVDSLHNYLLQRIPNIISTSKELAPYRQHDVVFNYTYFSKSTHQLILSLTITPNMYK